MRFSGQRGVLTKNFGEPRFPLRLPKQLISIVAKTHAQMLFECSTPEVALNTAVLAFPVSSYLC